MYNRFLLTLIAFLMSGVQLNAQSADSSIILTYEMFMEMVKDNHPLAVRADLAVTGAEAGLLEARGGFDPVAGIDHTQKMFKGTQYYRILNGGVRIPTWYGIEFDAGYDKASGSFLNPEAYTPENGLIYAGVSVNIGRGLFIDKRRAALQKAKLAITASDAERRQMLNELLLDAGRIYWTWYAAYHMIDVNEEAIRLATERLNAVANEAVLGDRAIIDTIEASVQLQNWQFRMLDAEVRFRNAGAELSTFLWDQTGIPLEITEVVVPDTLLLTDELDPSMGIDMEADSLLNDHPIIQMQRISIEQMSVDRRMAVEQFKPVLKLKYNALTTPVNRNPVEGYSINDYTYGLQFTTPLFFRKERGRLKMQDVYIQEAQLDMSTYVADLRANYVQDLNTLNTTYDQISIYEETVDDLIALVEGERNLFSAGESSLFMVNARETTYVNAQIALINAVAKHRTARVHLKYALGILNEEI